MNLHDYATQTKISDADLAKSVGVTRGYITQLRLGLRKRPSLSVALKLERATGGKVPVKAWGIG